MTKILEPAQLDAFARDGVLIARGVLEPEDLQPVINELEAWVDQRARKLRARGEIQDLFENEAFEIRYGLLFNQSRKMGRGLDLMHYLGPAAFDFLHNPRLLDVVEQFVGREITCNPIQHLRAKPPAKYEDEVKAGFHNVSWHQDVGVMMAEGESSNILTCWLPLGDATVEMGCMQAMPGVIDRGYLKHVRLEGDTTISPELLPMVEPLDLECRKGDIVFLSRFTPHRSSPNMTEYCRWSLDLRYQTTGDHTGRTAHPDFVVRSEHLPIMNNYEQWQESWRDAFANPRGFAGHRIDQ